MAHIRQSQPDSVRQKSFKYFKLSPLRSEADLKGVVVQQLKILLPGTGPVFKVMSLLFLGLGVSGPLPSRERTTYKVIKTFVLKMAQVEARLWP